MCTAKYNSPNRDLITQVRKEFSSFFLIRSTIGNAIAEMAAATAAKVYYQNWTLCERKDSWFQCSINWTRPSKYTYAMCFPFTTIFMRFSDQFIIKCNAKRVSVGSTKKDEFNGNKTNDQMQIPSLNNTISQNKNGNSAHCLFWANENSKSLITHSTKAKGGRKERN